MGDRETLIQRFKRYYEDNRVTAGVDSSFDDAYEALTYSIIDEVGNCAEREDLHSIRSIVREFDEIRSSVHGSNDSVKERFEAEYRKLH
ncbi:hypothetical protein DNH61_02315 [Paenibacillus sambharensis]|uniref:Uncharacterized protein n=1 Tax=Paenibacillus sambharensis TaxID=1803190 RepID=A0A2W1LSK3_9BACL|nr:hypothetical protein [Paenibacillus sambharensis]PZD97474.1 hypothetical protein DNH61_02315 [Paenibacillus sambharensis]